MRKQKEEVITVTHAETLSWAIAWVSERWVNNLNKYRKLAETDRASAQVFVSEDIYRKKLLVLLQLYKIENGRDYDMEYDLEL